MIPRKSWAPWFAGHKARVDDRRFRVAMADEQREASRRLAERWCAEQAAGDERSKARLAGQVDPAPTLAPNRALILSIILVLLSVLAITLWKANS